MSTEQIRRDLSRKLQNQLGDTLKRELVIANHVLDTSQMAELMFEASVMVMRSIAASIAAMAQKPEDLASVYNDVIKAMFETEQRGRAEALARAISREGAPI